MSSKTEKPTDQKLKDAGEKGDIAKSHPFSLSIGMVVWWLALPVLAESALAFFMSYVDRLLSLEALEDELATRTYFFSVMVAGTVTPCAIAATVALALGGIQSRGRIARKRPWLDFNRINPASGLKQLFGLQRLFATAMATAMLTIVAFVFFLAGRPLLTALSALPISVHWENVFLGSLSVGWKAVGYSVLGGACLGVLDLMIQISLWKRRNKMSKDEVRREHKDQDGDPIIKAVRRGMHREMT